jgi:mono/diheme cytochrome c family protein
MSRLKRHDLTGIVLLSILLTGCGNQMFRQPSFEPLDTPRAASPVNSIPVQLSKAPSDAIAVSSPAYGDLAASTVAMNASTFSSREPDLPPANQSDNARNEAAPAAVNSLESPYPLTNAQFLSAGKTLFMNRCVQCHNVGGYGYGVVASYLIPHPPDLASPLVQKRSDGALFWTITMGQGKMPGFRDWTTPEERWALTAYVRSLKGAPINGTLLLDAHVSDTTSAPYPVYGEPGFERGRNTAPFKDLLGAPAPLASRIYQDKTEPQELIDKASE